MLKPRGRSHTTLTETATEVVGVLRRMEGIKMIAPGIIDARRSGHRHITAVYTTGGVELIISGQGVQKVAIHLVDPKQAKALIQELKNHKALRHILWGEREKKPGI